MRIGQWVVWFHLRTLCVCNGLDLSTVIHWISTGLGWDYSDSEILDTPPFCLPPAPLYTVSDKDFHQFRTWEIVSRIVLALFFLCFKISCVEMSIFEFLCQVTMLCHGVLIVYYPAHQGRMGVEKFRYLNKIFANTRCPLPRKQSPPLLHIKGKANGIYTQYFFSSQSLITFRLNFLFCAWSLYSNMIPMNHSVITRLKNITDFVPDNLPR